MAICKTDAITLARYDYSETSQVITFFTRQFGQVRVIAKGAKRPKSLLQGFHDLLTHYEIVYYQRTRGTGLQTLAESKLLEDFRALRSDPARAYAGCYAAELVGELCPEAEPNAKAFELLLELLRALSAGEPAQIVLIRFELQLYRLLGYGPELLSCALCKAAIRGPRRLQYSPLKGGALCARCAHEDAAAVPISAAAVAAMRLLASPEQFSIGRLRLLPGTAREMRSALNAQARFLFEREPRSLRFVQPAPAARTERRAGRSARGN